MKHQQYFRFSIYASLISFILILQNTQRLSQPSFILALLTIWVCLLFFAAFEQRQDQLRTKIMQALKSDPALTRLIKEKTGLSTADLATLVPTRHFKHSTLQSILNLIQQNRKDSSC